MIGLLLTLASVAVTLWLLYAGLVVVVVSLAKIIQHWPVVVGGAALGWVAYLVATAPVR
jgi:hypothetical protein